MSRRNRLRHPSRAEPFRDVKPVVLIICEGGTEKEYLEGFASFFRNSRVKTEVVGHVGVPRTVVEAARKRKIANEKQSKREKDENLKFDAVWGVIDVDEHPNLHEAVTMARDNKIHLAVSNPCFELWLYLHFADQPGMQHRHDMQDKLKVFLPTYDKHVEFKNMLARGYDQAVSRAQSLDEQASADAETGRNPSTSVWRLTQAIKSDTR